MSEVGKHLQFPVITDERGTLVVAEDAQLPFAIRRVYYMYDLSGARGFHAHRTLQQVAVCLRGSCTMLLDNGSDKTRHTLDDPTVGLLIEKMVWHEMHDFTPDCLLAVLASAPYDETDYIREYTLFKQEKSAKTPT